MDTHQGAIALVTGGAKGLGAGIARAFLRTGASVVVVDLDDAAGRALCDEMNRSASQGQSAIFCHADITRDEDLARVVALVGSTYGKLDCLVNNACLYADAGLASSRQQWLESWNVNVVGGALLVQGCRALLRASGAGSVVNLSSIAGKIGQLGRLLYPACKAAILQVTRSEAVELASERIRVNAVSPAWTWSPAMEHQVDGDRALADRVAAQMHPIGRVGEVDDVTAAVLFLCSPAARFLTGIDLPVDGGYSALGPDQGRAPAHWFRAARDA
jgi:NAD(P)-dependent dehydrogenase (short-subunit alcohol dehydrogenase family)